MNRHTWTSLAAIAALFLAAAPGGAAETPPRTIVASGESVVKAAPDRVRISVSVTSRAANAREASEANARTSKQVLEKLKAAVRAPGEVSTSGYELSAEYDYNQQPGGRSGPRLVGYVSTNRFAIVSADLAGVGALIDTAVGAGANQIDSIGFFLADEDSVRRQALLDAGHKARAEAGTIAESLGVTLGDVLQASSAGGATPIAYDSRLKAAPMMAAEGAPPTEVVPGSIEVRGSVLVTFSIR
jgi:uncharacterized protein YggE